MPLQSNLPAIKFAKYVGAFYIFTADGEEPAMAECIA